MSTRTPSERELITQLLKDIGIDDPAVVESFEQLLLLRLFASESAEPQSRSQAEVKTVLSKLGKHTRELQKQLRWIIRTEPLGLALLLGHEYLSHLSPDIHAEVNTAASDTKTDTTGDVEEESFHDRMQAMMKGRDALSSLEYRLGSLLESVQNIEVQYKTRGRTGRPTNERMDLVVSKLMDLYERLTGRKATSTDSSRQTGTFIEFAVSAISILAPDNPSLPSSDAIKKRVVKILRANKSERKK